MTQRRQRRARRASHGGFTMLEVLVALGIVSMITFMSWSITAQIASDQKLVTTMAERNQEVRVATTRMAQDISMAYLSSNESADALEPRTFFVGKRGGEDLLHFSGLGHRILWSDANESEQTWIAYRIADDPDNRGQRNLVRRESRRLSDEGWDQVPYESDVLLHDIEEVEIEYWNWQDSEWQPDWNTTNESERGRLPGRVRIRIKVKNREGAEPDYVVHETQARISMPERLQFIVN